MVSTFITWITNVTIHVLHDKPKFRLIENHGSLTRECRLHIRTSLDRAQQHADRAMRTKERQCLNHNSHFGCVVGVSSGTREGKMSLGGDNKTKQIVQRHTTQRRFHQSRREYLRLYEGTILGNHCLLHVLWSEHLEDADIWLRAWAAGSFGAGIKGMCLVRHVA